MQMFYPPRNSLAATAREAGHLTIGDGVQIQAQSGIASNIEADSKLFGSPAMNYGDFIRSFTIFKKLPDLAKKLNQLEKTLKG